MSVQTEITRVQGLVNRLIAKLKTLGHLDNTAHDFQDAVEACRNIGDDEPTPENKTVTLGENQPPSVINPSSGCIINQLTFNINGNQINPSYIVANNSIVGVPGVALINNIDLRRMSFVVSAATETNTVTINVQNAFQGSYPVMPVFNELMLFKRSNSFSSNKKTCLTLFHNLNKGYGEYTCMKSDGSFYHLGDSSNTNLVTYSYSSDAKELTINLTSSDVVFYGNYVLYVYY